jgi:hypothetical protein
MDHNAETERGPAAGTGSAVGSFRLFFTDQRWEWSDDVAAMHGYAPGQAVSTTELLLAHKHPDDKTTVAETLERVLQTGEPFSSNHRIIDTRKRASIPPWHCYHSKCVSRGTGGLPALPARLDRPPTERKIHGHEQFGEATADAAYQPVVSAPSCRPHRNYRRSTNIDAPCRSSGQQSLWRKEWPLRSVLDESRNAQLKHIQTSAREGHEPCAAQQCDACRLLAGEESSR